MDETPRQHYERLLKVVQDSILQNYPNPERKGCPGEAVIREVAERRGPIIEDDAFEHITHCSPCYREFTEYKQQGRRKRRLQRLLLFSLLAVALGVLIWKLKTS